MEQGARFYCAKTSNNCIVFYDINLVFIFSNWNVETVQQHYKIINRVKDDWKDIVIQNIHLTL